MSDSKRLFVEHLTAWSTFALVVLTAILIFLNFGWLNTAKEQLHATMTPSLDISLSEDGKMTLTQQSADDIRHYAPKSSARTFGVRNRKGNQDVTIIATLPDHRRSRLRCLVDCPSACS